MGIPYIKIFALFLRNYWYNHEKRLGNWMKKYVHKIKDQQNT